MTDASHAASVEAWRHQRYEALRRDIGWLTLVGLGWLKAGINRLGADPSSDVVLPGGPSFAGSITVSEGRVTATGDFLHDGEPVRDLAMANDQEGEATMLELGPLRLCVIERGGRLAIRTWDTASTARRDFDGIDHWPVDPAWRVTARFDPTPGRVLPVPDVLGTIDQEESPGDVAFNIAGDTHRLQALTGGEHGEMWLVFGDETSGEETYGGGRFLYTGAPDVDGTVIVDFNRAYNPPCVFSSYATCPLPWPKNRLPIRIEAGEQMYRSVAFHR